MILESVVTIKNQKALLFSDGDTLFIRSIRTSGFIGRLKVFDETFYGDNILKIFYCIEKNLIFVVGKYPNSVQCISLRKERRGFPRQNLFSLRGLWDDPEYLKIDLHYNRDINTVEMLVQKPNGCISFFNFIFSEKEEVFPNIVKFYSGNLIILPRNFQSIGLCVALSILKKNNICFYDLPLSNEKFYCDNLKIAFFGECYSPSIFNVDSGRVTSFFNEEVNLHDYFGFAQRNCLYYDEESEYFYCHVLTKTGGWEFFRLDEELSSLVPIFKSKGGYSKIVKFKNTFYQTPENDEKVEFSDLTLLREVKIVEVVAHKLMEAGSERLSLPVLMLLDVLREETLFQYRKNEK